jgi:Dna[CI] antecedent, DciA
LQTQGKFGPRPIQELISSFLREEGLGTRGRSHRVFKAWNQALEPGLRKWVEPVRFRSGELLVEVRSSAHLHDLRGFTGEDYRRKTNEALGEETVRKVVFKLRT